MLSRRLTRKIIRLSLPAMLESLLLAKVLLIDTILVGWLHDPSALAAVALGGTFFFVLQGIFMAIGVGSMAMTSRAWGAGNRREANAVTAHAIGVSVLAGVVLSVLCYWLVIPYLRVMGADADVVESGALYLRILLYTAPVSLTMLVTFSNLRATGDSMTPLKINAVYNVLNIVLDVILIFGFGPIPALGLAGAAWATAISGLIAGLMAFHMVRGGKTQLEIIPREIIHWQINLVRRMLKIAIPTLIEVTVQRTGFIVFMSMVTSLGTTALAAHAVGLRVESLSFNPGFGFSIAAAALVGQALGAGKPLEAVRIGVHACILAMLFMGSLGLVFLAGGPWIVRIFGATPEVVELAGQLIRIAAASQIFMAAFFVLGGVLRGSGDTRSPLIVTLVGTLPLRLGLVWVFGFYFGWGIHGVWWACVIDWSLRAAMMYWFFRRGKWKDTVV